MTFETELHRHVRLAGSKVGMYFSKIDRKFYSELVDYLGYDSGDVLTNIYCALHKVDPRRCAVCNKIIPVPRFSTGWGSEKFCSNECKRAHNWTHNTWPGVLEDFRILLDKDGNINKNLKDRHLNVESFEYLKASTGSDSDDIGYLLWKYLKNEPHRTCAECGVELKFGSFKVPFRDNQKFCSDACRDKNQDYRDALSKGKLGISRLESTNFVDSVSVPAYELMVKKYESSGFELLHTYEEYMNLPRPKAFSIRCLECGYTTTRSNHRCKCPKCYPNSKEQDAITDFIATMVDRSAIVVNDRRTIKPLEIDICVPSMGIGFEYDGFYYHDNKDNFNKYEACAAAGVRLIKIFEDEWYHKNEIVLSRIRSVLGSTTEKIYARKCTVREISSKESKEFLERNHIQGSISASIRYGLEYNGRLVSVMTLSKPRYDKVHDYELIRFASELNVTVVGAASKLFSAFKRNFPDASVISYCDLRYGSGEVYKKLGFEYTGNTKRGYFWTKGGNRYNRIGFQKHKLKSILSDFDQSLTESENMFRNGYYKIYDYGSMVFQWKP